MSSIARRALSKLARLRSRAAVPGTLANLVQLYSRLYTTDELQVTRGGGITVQLTGVNAEGFPKGYIVNFAINRQGTTGLTLFPGYCRSDDDEFDIFSDVTVTLDLTTVGPNGLDAGALVANTWYAVWVIGDSTHTNTPGKGLVSTSFAAPAMPAGYDKKRRVGVMRANSSAQVQRFFQRHAGLNSAIFIPAGIRSRRYYWDVATTLRVTNGTATAFTSVSFASDMPSTSRRALLEARFAAGTAGATTDELELRPAGANSADGPYAIRRGTVLSATQMDTAIEVPTDDAQAVDYKVTQGGANQNTASLRCVGFVDEV